MFFIFIFILLIILFLVLILSWKNLVPSSIRSQPLSVYNITDSFNNPLNLTVTKTNPDLPLYTIHSFLSDQEVNHLLNLSQSRRSRSKVSSESDNKDEIHTNRTSYSSHFKAHEDSVIKSIESRASLLTGFPISHIEPLQVVSYTDGQEYKPHYDAFNHTSNTIKLSGNRDTTILVYLTTLDDNKGGETNFPELNLKFKPIKGMALMWNNLDNNKRHPKSLHGSIPIHHGCFKSAVNIWIRQKPYIG